jgi:MoaA/NifB/PqqE/SkfB family radical SAM enzyme
MWNHTYRRFYEGINYRLRTFAGGSLASYCRPVSIGFMLTNLCNARCVHCDIWKNRGKEDTPSVEEWKTVMTDLRSWLGPVSVFFSGGEALLRPYAPDLVAHGSSLGLSVEFLTHGYWDDQTKIEKLALANPWRATISLDGMGDTHTKIRGRDKFFEKTTTTIKTLQRVRKDKKLDFTIRLKTVIMNQNLDDVCEVAKYATQEGMHGFFQAVEQTYNTPEDPRWFEHCENWPADPEKAVSVVQQLIRMKREGYHIDNSFAQLEAMIPYFRNPDAMRVAMQSHSAHEGKPLCTALVNVQFQPNGDVLSCWGMSPIGNIRTTPIRQIWEQRPRWWLGGCCLERRCTDAEKQTFQIAVTS